VYFESFGEVQKAINREKQLKGWIRAKKVALIGSRDSKVGRSCGEVGTRGGVFARVDKATVRIP
jgi:hypothetical protein